MDTIGFHVPISVELADVTYELGVSAFGQSKIGEVLI